MKVKASTSQNARSALGAFTLVEVVISVAILALMMIALYSAFIFGFASIKTTREDERATQILTQKLEAIRLIQFSQLGTMPKTFVDYYDPSATNGRAGAVYYGTITTNAPSMIPSTASYKSQIYLITASVTWTNYLNSFKGTNSVTTQAPVAHTRQMQTLSALNGVQNYIYGSQ